MLRQREVVAAIRDPSALLLASDDTGRRHDLVFTTSVFLRATQSYSAKTCGVGLMGSGCVFSEAPASVKVFRLDQSTAQMLKEAMKMCRFHQ